MSYVHFFSYFRYLGKTMILLLICIAIMVPPMFLALGLWSTVFAVIILVINVLCFEFFILKESLQD